MRTPFGAWRATYTQGRWVVLGGPASMVIMQPAPPTATKLVNDLWDKLVAGASIAEISAALTRFGLDTMPDLAVVFWDDERLHCLLRGGVRVLDAESGEVLASGAGARTWYETSLPTHRVYLPLDDVQPDQLLRLPLLVGAAQASTVYLDAVAGPVGEARVGGQAAVGIAVGRDEGPALPAAMAAGFVAGPQPGVGLVVGVPELPAEPPAAAEGLERWDEQTEPAVGPELWDEQTEPAVETELWDEPVVLAVEAELWDEPAVPAVGAEPSVVVEEPESADGWVAGSGQAASPSPAAPLASGAESPPVPELAPIPVAVAAVVPAPQLPVARFSQEPTQVLGQRPPYAPGQLPGEQAAPSALAVQEFGQGATGTTGPWGVQGFAGLFTASEPSSAVSQGEVGQRPDEQLGVLEPAELLGAVRKPGVPQQPGEQPGVPQPGEQPGVPQPGEQPVVPQPDEQPRTPAVLAIVASPAGERLQLLGPILIGRAPSRAGRDSAADLLRVPSPNHDISRTHVQITPREGWIEVQDLHSTNGTLVIRPNGQRVRLEPGQSVELEVGGAVDLGDGQVITLLTA